MWSLVKQDTQEFVPGFNNDFLKSGRTEKVGHKMKVVPFYVRIHPAKEFLVVFLFRARYSLSTLWQMELLGVKDCKISFQSLGGSIYSVK